MKKLYDYLELILKAIITSLIFLGTSLFFLVPGVGIMFATDYVVNKKVRNIKKNLTYGILMSIYIYLILNLIFILNVFAAANIFIIFTKLMLITFLVSYVLIIAIMSHKSKHKGIKLLKYSFISAIINLYKSIGLGIITIVFLILSFYINIVFCLLFATGVIILTYNKLFKYNEKYNQILTKEVNNEY